MKKLLFFFIFCNLILPGFSFSAGDLFVYNSRFWQNEVSLNITEQGLVSAGLTFDLTEHKDIKDKIYALHLPVILSFPMLDLAIEPFWYPESSNAQAYGGSLRLESLIRGDDINNVYASGYLKAAYANQKANIVRGIAPQNKENFKQAVFEGGLNFNFANLYNFNVNGNLFTYPDKVKNVTSFGGIMNQCDLADLGTIDYILNFPKFSLGGGITWMSSENNTQTLLSYKYINYEQNLISHSVMFKTMIPVTQNMVATLIYNHLFERKRNKDLFGIGLNYLF